MSCGCARLGCCGECRTEDAAAAPKKAVADASRKRVRETALVSKGEPAEKRARVEEIKRAADSLVRGVVAVLRVATGDSLDLDEAVRLLCEGIFETVLLFTEFHSTTESVQKRARIGGEEEAEDRAAVELKRTCYHCRQEKPLTREFFWRNQTRRGRNGFAGSCKKCTESLRRSRPDGVSKTLSTLLGSARTSSAKRIANGRHPGSPFAIDLAYMELLHEFQGARCARTNFPFMEFQPGVDFSASIDRADDKINYVPNNCHLTVIEVNTNLASTADWSAVFGIVVRQYDDKSSVPKQTCTKYTRDELKKLWKNTSFMGFRHQLFLMCGRLRSRDKKKFGTDVGVVTPNEVLDMLCSAKQRCALGSHYMALPGSSEPPWMHMSVDRLDVTRPHTRDNCQLICRLFNSIRRGSNKGMTEGKLLLFTLTQQYVRVTEYARIDIMKRLLEIGGTVCALAHRIGQMTSATVTPPPVVLPPALMLKWGQMKLTLTYHWTHDEHELLKQVVGTQPNKSCLRWDIVALSFPRRTAKQCKDRWYSMMPRYSSTRQFWTESEHAILVREVEKFRGRDVTWSEVAKRLPRWTPRQCRSRIDNLKQAELRGTEGH